MRARACVYEIIFVILQTFRAHILANNIIKHINNNN